MFVKIEKTCRWKVGRAGVQQQFIEGKTYEVADWVGKQMIDSEYAVKGKGSKAEPENKIVQPESKEDGAEKTEKKDEKSESKEDEKSEEKSDDNKDEKSEEKTDEKAKSSIFSRKK